MAVGDGRRPPKLAHLDTQLFSYVLPLHNWVYNLEVATDEPSRRHK